MTEANSTVSDISRSSQTPTHNGHGRTHEMTSGTLSHSTSALGDYCDLCGNALRVHGDCIYCTNFDRTHRYLVVAPETASSSELKDLLYEMAASNARVAFVLLVPAIAPAHLLVWEPGEPRQIAQRKAEEARALLARAHVNVVGVEVGAPSVQGAIEDELRSHPGAYDGVILCTLPPGASKWVGLDVPNETRTKFGIPLIRVTGGGALR
jgi:hypothetical protein